MTIAVLGGAGYIGSHTVAQLVKAGEDVVVLDNLITGHRQAVDPKARFYQGDIRDYKFLSSVFSKEKIEGIIHFAAFSIVPESMKDPLKYFDNNTGGLITLLEAMHQFGINKIVFSSTAATYGEPKSIPIKETDPQVPTNPYGESKLAMEKKLCTGATLRTASSLSRCATSTSPVPCQTAALVRTTTLRRT